MRKTLVVTICSIAAFGMGACSDPTAPGGEVPIPTESSVEVVPTVTHWLNQPCPTPGARAKTRSGGNIVCRQVGSDPTPEWHAE